MISSDNLSCWIEKNLFDTLPMLAAVIDSEYNVVMVNNAFELKHPTWRHQKCYQVYNKRNSICPHCINPDVFKDGKPREHAVIDDDGNKVELLVTTVPFEIKNNAFNHLLKISVDITDTIGLQETLKMTNNTLSALISSSLYGVIAVDEHSLITVFNQAAERMLDIKDINQLEENDFSAIFPKDFLEKVSASEEPVYLHETTVHSFNGDFFPARLTGVRLAINDQYKGKAFWIHDIRRIKKLEAEKIEAERLATVGKTVAGLAHGIKNAITGLEGGEYLLNSGLNTANLERIKKGAEMLNRNIKRVSTFVREFLNFSKGQEIEVNFCDPIEIAKEVVNNYSVKISQLGIKLITNFQNSIATAPIDNERMRDCLANMLGNAIDACLANEEQEHPEIIVNVFEKENTIVYEFIDNGCGMNNEIKRKIFTTFFTTKGLEGTGLGLLMTQKTVQQHGGIVEFDSKLNQGTTFKILLPRDHLPILNQ
ncbi:MAG: GHKL domain-containing protein [Deltaproteobacteria bacterium]|jgi:nitrogen-specific signal transduction histidine kinase|nr:GHKL domain-containing protein [Deltaproteobacteria bacterium]